MTSLSGTDIDARVGRAWDWGSRIHPLSRLRETQWLVVNLWFGGLGWLMTLTLALMGLSAVSARIEPYRAEPTRWASPAPSTRATSITPENDIPYIQFQP